MIKSRGINRISMRKKERKLKPTTLLAFAGDMLYWGEFAWSLTNAEPQIVKIAAIKITCKIWILKILFSFFSIDEYL